MYSETATTQPKRANSKRDGRLRQLSRAISHSTPRSEGRPTETILRGQLSEGISQKQGRVRPQTQRTSVAMDSRRHKPVAARGSGTPRPLLITDRPTEIIIGKFLARWKTGKDRPSYVYAWIRAGVPLYIGSTCNIQGRLSGHHVIGRKEPVGNKDEIRIWQFASARLAFGQEMMLIRLHRPRYNYIEERDGQRVRAQKRIRPVWPKENAA